MRIEAKFTYIYDSRRKIHLRIYLNRSIDTVSIVSQGCIYQAYTRLILKVKLPPRLMLLLHARLFALPSPLNSNSSSVSYRISRGNLSTMWIVDRRPLIDTIGSIRERLRMAAERKERKENRSATLCYTPPKILLTSEKWRHPLRLLKV